MQDVDAPVNAVPGEDEADGSGGSGSALDRWTRVADVPLLCVAIGSLPLLLLELERPNLPPGDRVFLTVVNLVVLVAFATDFVVGITLARDRASYTRSRWANVLIIVAQVVSLVPGLGVAGAARLLRGGPLVRVVLAVVRLFAVGGTAQRNARTVVRRHAAAFALGLAGLTWLSAAVLFTLVEDVGTAGRLESFFDGLWWSTTTITTVGYGDVYPVTGVGRVIGGVTMAVGISTFALVTAKVAEFLVRED
jgi:voltage-gated potassium channel